MLNNLPLTIGTGGQYVFRTGGVRPDYLAFVGRPTFLARAGESTYGVSEIGHGGVFRIGGEPILHSTGGAMTIGGPRSGTPSTGLAGEPISSGGSYPCHISAHPEGSWLYVSNYGDGVVRAIRLDEMGGFEEWVDLRHEGSGPVKDRQGGSHAHFSAVVDAYLVIADLGTDHLRVHELRDGRPGAMHLVRMPAGSGPRHFARVGDRLIVAGELDGTLTEVDIRSWSVIRSVAASTSRGQHLLSHILYVHGAVLVGVRGANMISVLDEDLRILDEIPTLTWPRHFAYADSPTGPLLLVAGERTDEIAAHPITADPFHVGEISERLAVPAPMFIGVGEEF